MKKLINSPETVVTDALEGVAAAHPSLSVDVENKVITRAGGPTPGKVGLVSGGGSGHEPLHGGFVGYGMLDAACPGEVFTSPTPDPIVAATQTLSLSFLVTATDPSGTSAQIPVKVLVVGPLPVTVTPPAAFKVPSTSAFVLLVDSEIATPTPTVPS